MSFPTPPQALTSIQERVALKVIHHYQSSLRSTTIPKNQNNKYVIRQCQTWKLVTSRHNLSSNSCISTTSSFAPYVRKILVFPQKASVHTLGNTTKTNSQVNSRKK